MELGRTLEVETKTVSKTFSRFGKANPAYKHGHNQTNSPTYRVWIRMRQRCNDENCRDYKEWYGSKGVSVCKRWDNFELFLLDMGERPEGASIDRINNRLGYSKKNCRWATPREQGRNKCNTHLLTYGGLTLSLVGWAEHLGISYETFKWRVYNWKSKKKIFERRVDHRKNSNGGRPK